MGKTRRTIEVEVYYTVLVHRADGTVEKVGWFDFEAEAVIVGLLHSRQQGVKMAEIIGSYGGDADGPETNGICVHGRLWVEEAGGSADYEEYCAEMAMHLIHRKTGEYPAPDHPEIANTVYALAEAYDLLGTLPPKPERDEDAIIDRAADTYHAQLLHDVIISEGDERPNLDPSERKALLEFIDRRLG